MVKIKGVVAPDKELGVTIQEAAEFRRGIIKILNDTKEWFDRVRLMYGIAFAVGIGLIVGAAIFSAVYGRDMYALIFGGLGLTDIVALFITNPTKGIQESSSNLIQLQTAFRNWYATIYQWDRYLNNKITPSIGPKDLEEIFEIMRRNTEQTVKLMEECCEWPKKK